MNLLIGFEYTVHNYNYQLGRAVGRTLDLQSKVTASQQVNSGHSL